MHQTHIVISTTSDMTITEVCQRYSISETAVQEMIAYGLFQTEVMHTVTISPAALRKIESAIRLQRDLGINLPGVVLALELKEELEILRSEVQFLHKYLAN